MAKKQLPAVGTIWKVNPAVKVATAEGQALVMDVHYRDRQVCVTAPPLILSGPKRGTGQWVDEAEWSTWTPAPPQ